MNKAIKITEVSPIIKVRSYRCHVTQNKWVNSRYKHLCLTSENIDFASRTQAGQFYQLKCPQTNDLNPFLLRPMSVYSLGASQNNQDKNQIEFLYNVMGLGTQALSSLVIDAPMDIVGPLGNSFYFKPSFKKILLIVRGVGLATLAPLLKQAYQHNIGINVIMSARHQDDLMQDQFLQGIDLNESYAKMHLNVHCLYDSDGSSSMETLETLVSHILKTNTIDALYTCGSERILMLLQKLLINYPDICAEVALEQRMACGMGVCLSCVKLFRTQDGETKFRRICRDGPIFPISEVAYFG